MVKLQHMEKLLGSKTYIYTIIIFLTIILYHSCDSLNTGIIPRRYISWRKHKTYNPFLDIRKNLFTKNGTKQNYNNQFVYYKIKSTSYKDKCNLQELPSIIYICLYLPSFATK